MALSKKAKLFLIAELISLVFVAGFIWLAIGMRPTAEPAATELPVLGQVPPFEFTERSGRSVNLEDLTGHVWIAEFVFTRCRGPCPILIARMAQVQDDLRTTEAWSDLRLVSVTVDPGYDTPEVLAQRAEAEGADPQQWLWLTGGREAIWQWIREGFNLAVAESPENEAEPIAHSTRMVLVDRSGRIRGYYSVIDEAERQRLLEDAMALARQ